MCSPEDAAAQAFPKPLRYSTAALALCLKEAACEKRVSHGLLLLFAPFRSVIPRISTCKKILLAAV